jgi:hypothetical protein
LHVQFTDLFLRACTLKCAVDILKERHQSIWGRNNNITPFPGSINYSILHESDASENGSGIVYKEELCTPVLDLVLLPKNGQQRTFWITKMNWHIPDQEFLLAILGWHLRRDRINGDGPSPNQNANGEEAEALKCSNGAAHRSSIVNETTSKRKAGLGAAFTAQDVVKMRAAPKRR